MTRRTLLSGVAGMTAMGGPNAFGAGQKILDAHIHLFDPTRKQGVPWPDKTNAVLYRPALPARYRELAVPLGVKGAIVVEASPWVDDNQWVLDTAAKDPIIVGFIGNLDPAAKEFPGQLERLERSTLFRGLRYGNLWNRDLGGAVKNPTFVENVKRLAQAGLTFDTANPNAALLSAVLALNEKVPDLRIVIDHLPQMSPFADKALLRELAGRQLLYVKVSEVPRRVDGKVPADLAFYRDRLDMIWETFGENRLLFGSDWPNSDQWLPYGEIVKMVDAYFSGKSAAAKEKYFWTNSQSAYAWKARS